MISGIPQVDVFNDIVTKVWTNRKEVIHYYKSISILIEKDLLYQIENSDAVCILNGDFINAQIGDTTSIGIYYGNYQQVLSNKSKFISKSNNELRNIDKSISILEDIRRNANG